MTIIERPWSAVAVNDIARLGLRDCLEGTVAAPSGLSVSLSAGEISLTWNGVTGAGLYEVQHAEGVGGDWKLITTTSATSTVFRPDGGLECGTTHRFRLRALGDGETYAPEWGAESAEQPVTTAACNGAPVFATTTYSFTVREDAATSTVVGTMSATDPDDDTLSYSIADGDGSGPFAVGDTSGEIIVAGSLDHETTPSHSLTVMADDGRGGSVTATVEVSVTDVAEEAPPAPSRL